MTIDNSFYSSIYSGTNTKNITEDRNCIQLEPRFLFNPSNYNPDTQEYESYYVREFVAVDDYTYYVLCSENNYTTPNTIYKVSGGIRELYCKLNELANWCRHSIIHADSNHNLYFRSFNTENGVEYFDYGIYKLSKEKIRSLLIKIPDINSEYDIMDFVVSEKTGYIYILYKTYSDDYGYCYYLDKYSLTDYTLIKQIALNDKKPDTYDSQYRFEPERLFLKSDGTPYIYGRKISLE